VFILGSFSMVPNNNCVSVIAQIMFNGQGTEVIFKLLTLNIVKFLPAVNG
jgi:hypothetical protein